MDNELLLRQAINKNSLSKKCKCGGTMTYSVLGYYVCSACHAEEEDLYGLLKGILEEYPNINKMDLVRVLGIPLRVINQYIKDGRLVNPKGDLYE